MKRNNMLVIDFETLSDKVFAPHVPVVLEMSAFLFDINEVESFADLILNEDRFFRTKFSVESQRGAEIDKGTLQFWAEAGSEAQKILKPSEEDVTLKEGMTKFIGFLEENQFGVFGDSNTDLMVCRGMDFDFNILCMLIEQCFEGKYDLKEFPVPYWAKRDSRSMISAYLNRVSSKVPFKKGEFEGFVRHNSLHDVVKEVCCLQMAKALSEGRIDIDQGAEYEWV